MSRNAILGENCTLGQNVYIGEGVRIGRGVKLQNNVSVYSGVELADSVFVGPSVVFTNVKNPRASLDRKAEFVPTTVGRGATLGANATIVCGTRLGEGCLVGAGSVVTRDVAPHSVVQGNPARHTGWVDERGERLSVPPRATDALLQAPATETTPIRMADPNGRSLTRERALCPTTCRGESTRS